MSNVWHILLRELRAPITKTQLGIIILTGFAIVWLVQPVNVEQSPGFPIHFKSQGGSDSGVVGLTVRGSKESNHAVETFRWVMRTIPLSVATAVQHTSLAGTQFDARHNGVTSASIYLGHVAEIPSAVIIGKVTGASSGLAWAIATVSLEDSEFLDGERVGMTGIVSSNGKVGKIAGLYPKMSTEELRDTETILVPDAMTAEGNKYLNVIWSYKDTKKQRPGLVGVRTVSEAVGVLCLRHPTAKNCQMFRRDVMPEQTSRLDHATRIKIADRFAVVISSDNTPFCRQLLNPASAWFQKVDCIILPAGDHDGGVLLISRQKP